MELMAVLAAAVIGVVVLAALISFNRFVHQRQYIDNAWANVETELQRRYELIPNLVATVKGYAAHERATLQEVVEARQLAADDHGTVDHQAETENVLVGALKHLLAVSEAYPDLQADEHFLHLQRQLVATENRIQAARRLFNNNVRDYNRRVQSFPSLLVAKAGGFEERPYFEIAEAVHAVPTVQLDR